ncbi:MAG: methyl-accepting chemotaxis protein, partial [Myxococcaceae bacterium]
RKLGAGELKATPENLRRALKECNAFPDKALWINFQNWVGGAFLIALSYRLVAGVPWSVSGRVAFLGAALGPATSMLTHVLVISRARKALGKCAAGLSLSDVVRTLPPKRLQLRLRLMAFTAVCVLTPTVFILDATVRRTDRTLERILEQPTPSAQAQVLAADQGEGWIPIAALGAIVIMMVISTGVIVGNALDRPMRGITVEATRIASGDLRTANVIPAEDEVWAVASAFTSMQAQLTDAISRLVTAGTKIGGATGELVKSSEKHEAGAAQQASALAETSATTEELARSARQIAENAGSVARLAEQTLQAAQAGMKSAEAFFASMGRMRKGNQGIADSVVKLNKRVQQIGRIVEFINGIADKSDLLALNAELEGTKAGEVGRGFSLVAAEMRRLAESVMESTREIGRLIEEIRDATNSAVMATEAGVKATDAGSALSQQVSEKLQSILSHAGQTFDAVRTISLATHQQQSGTDQLAVAMTDVLRSTQVGAAATKQMVAANADLSTLAGDLKEVVDRFTVS